MQKIDVNLGLDEKKKKKQNTSMSESSEFPEKPQPFKKISKPIDITMTPNLTAGGENDLTKIFHREPVKLTKDQAKWFFGTTDTKLPTLSSSDWQNMLQVMFDEFAVRQQLAEQLSLGEQIRRDNLETLDSKIDWSKWLGTPAKNPIQEFDK